jgi:hypothetical protein
VNWLEHIDIAWHAHRGRARSAPNAVPVSGTVSHGSERQFVHGGRSRTLPPARNMTANQLLKRERRVVVSDIECPTDTA